MMFFYYERWEEEGEGGWAQMFDTCILNKWCLWAQWRGLKNSFRKSTSNNYNMKCWQYVTWVVRLQAERVLIYHFSSDEKMIHFSAYKFNRGNGGLSEQVFVFVINLRLILTEFCKRKKNWNKFSKIVSTCKKILMEKNIAEYLSQWNAFSLSFFFFFCFLQGWIAKIGGCWKLKSSKKIGGRGHTSSRQTLLLLTVEFRSYIQDHDSLRLEIGSFHRSRPVEWPRLRQHRR